jgi:predicted MFS family arabinose efflux permease
LWCANGALDSKTGGKILSPYLQELRANWRPVSAAFIGMSGGLLMAQYVVGVMGPYLVDDMGWSRSEFSLLAGLGLVSVLAFPFIGRITDIVGVRLAVMVGIISSPLIFLAMSQLQDMRTYAILFTLQCLLLVTTTPPVYCRVVVQYFGRARGVALAIVASGAALTVTIGGPLLNNFIADHGWRAGYVVLAIFTAIVGTIALILLPRERKAAAPQTAAPGRRTSKQEYGRIFGAPAFWVILAGNMLTTPAQAVMTSQFSLILAENGAAGKAASAMIGLFAGGTLVGRFLGGLALDRFPAPAVAAVGFSISAIGLFLFASGYDARIVLMIAALLFGLTTGAENDVVAYMIARKFGVDVYSTVHGLVAASSGAAAVIGIVLNSVMLAQFGEFNPFLIVCGVISIIGGLVFLWLPRTPTLSTDAHHDAVADSATG